MKHTALVIYLLLTAIFANAQVPYIQWQKCLGGSLLDAGQYVIQTTDSGYLVAGTTESNDGDVSGNHGLYDCWLAKLDGAGSLLWQKTYGGTLSDNCNFVQQTADGGYIFGAHSRSNDGDLTSNKGIWDIWVVKTTATGAITWQKSLGGTGVDYLHCLRQTSDGGYILAGNSNSNDSDVSGNHGGDDVWVVKLDATGAIMWQKSYGGTGDDAASMICQTKDGGYLVSGTTSSNDGDVSGNHGGDDIWVIKLTATGAITWQKCYGGSGDDAMTADSGSGGLEQTADSGIIVAGWSNSTDGDVTGNHGNYDFWVIRLNPTGTLLWQRSLGGTGDDEATSLQQTSDTGYIIAGTSFSNDGDVSGNHGGYDNWITKLSPTGSLQWQKCMGGTGMVPGECPNGIRQTFGGGYILAGYTSANDSDVSGYHGAFDFWVVKLNCIAPDAGIITGPSAVCKGSTITLADAAVGGGWHVQTGNASVTGGVVTGTTAGTDIVSYSVTNTCGSDMVTHAVTINPLPTPLIVVTGTTLTTTAAYTTYQWLLGGTPITGATNASYMVTHSGSYGVTVTDVNGCSGTSALPQTVIPAGISGAGSAEQIRILPNPTTGKISVTGSRYARVCVYNTIGQQVVEAVSTDHVSLSALPVGIYIVRVLDEYGQLLKQEKVTKQD